ncbi:MAG: adenylosuccinate lyase, partial [Gammaproteobacteria bacterium]|nr:adenylosuccinate lyase [Gammaproteobacteria bacterium]
LSPDESRMSEDLDSAWETLAEAVQTVMRAHGCENAYEQLKDLSRNQIVTRDSLHSYLKNAELPDGAREALRALTPATYTGIAEKLAE